MTKDEMIAQGITHEEYADRQQSYELLSMLVENRITFTLADSCQRKVDAFKLMTSEEQQKMLEELKPYESKPVSQGAMNRKLQRLIPKGYDAAYTNRVGY